MEKRHIVGASFQTIFIIAVGFQLITVPLFVLLVDKRQNSFLKTNRMKINIHRTVLALLLLTTTSALAADFEKGKKAYDKGDYKTALQEWQPLAEQGHAEAQHNLGNMYNDGEGVTKDNHQAVFWYRKSAEHGNAKAQFKLGYMYANGWGVTKDESQTEIWCRKAAEQDRLRKVAEQGDAIAQLYFGVMYLNGWGISKDYGQAAFWLRKSAEQGNAKAQTNLGNMYLNGWGIPKNYSQAVSWYRKAAEQGLAQAQHNMGLMYANGQGVPKNDRQAVSWYRKAAEQGLAEAQTNLGLMYEEGKGVWKSHRRAVSWYRKAAEQGNEVAQINMGNMYLNGWGISKNYSQAVSWYRKAAEQGLAEAQTNLGVMYLNGWGVAQDYNQAVSWYRKAAEQGLAEAHNNMGFMYLNGKGVPTDYVRAYAWFNLSSAKGCKNAEKARDGLQWHMTPSQLAKAQELSREIESRIAQGYEGELDSLPVADASEPVLEEPELELESNASGFVIGRDGETTFIVTNHHVVEDCDKVSVIYAGKSYEASVRAKDANSDLALLETNIPAARPASFSRLSRARLGEAVTAAGYPLQGLLSKSLNVTGGNVSALAGLGDDAKHLQITAPLQPGNSGGPLLDASGNVVGVAASKLNAIAAAELTGDLPQNVNFAIKAALVRSFLDIHAVDYQRLPSETKLEPEQLAERARQFTVAVHCWK